MNTIKIYTEEILDPQTEIHYAFHRSLKDITVKHTHDFYEIFLIAKGKVQHEINDSKQVLEEGTMIFMRPSDVHYYQKFKDWEVELINLAFPKTTIVELLNYLGEGFDSDRLLKSKFPPSIILSSTEKNILIKRFEKLHLLPLESKSEIRTSLRVLLAEIITNYFSKSFWKERSSTPRWLETTRSEMQKKENFVAGFSTMTKISDKSKEHLCREFKKYFELTPTEYINDLRLNYSANLLMTTDESIPFISLECGFENLSHYYHLFKNKFKLSPGDFRNKNRKNVIPS
ncbi:MAG: AraC family transcriptional regulator [Candidatus Cloacimonetes bacterium]|nr:AraC family transcriptional regulator [Candidatus Cloacimonadota bacterium]